MQNFFKSSLIDVKQLKEMIDYHDVKNLRILDCTLPFDKGSFLYKRQRIPNALFFDVAGLRDTSSNYTMTFPKPENFRPFLEHLNISKKNFIICYDQYGIFSSPRAWFIFKAYDFPNVCVLNGGFPKWLGSGYEIENKQLDDLNLDRNLDKIYDEENAKELETEDLKLNSNILVDLKYVMEARKKKIDKSVLLDTRHPMKYEYGNIPNSINIPYTSFINPDHTFKTKEEIKEVFEEKGYCDVDSKEFISYCTIGLTACIGYLALNSVVGNENVKLYDGSYEEFSDNVNNSLYI